MRYLHRNFYFIFLSLLACGTAASIDGEIREILFEKMLDGEISYSQIQVILQELRASASCSEISGIYQNHKLFLPELQDFFRENCGSLIPESTQMGGASQAKLSHLEFQMEEGFLPQSRRASLKITHQENRLTVRTEPGLPVSHRQVVVAQGPYYFKAGNLTRLNQLPFINQRQSWPGLSPDPGAPSPFFSPVHQFNGLQTGYSSGKVAQELYFIANPSLEGGQPVRATAAGVSSQLNLASFRSRFGSEFTSLDRDLTPAENRLISGINLSLGKNLSLETGTGHSLTWINRPDKSKNPSRHGLYGDLHIFTDHRLNQFYLFQASRHWESPFMDLSKKFTETSEFGTEIRGSGEGGAGFSSRIPIEPLPAKWNLSTACQFHWYLKKPEWKYLQNEVGLSYRESSHALNLNLKKVSTDTTNYLNMESKATLTVPLLLINLNYSHKFGHYLGESPRSLSVRGTLAGSRRWTTYLKWKDIYREPGKFLVILNQELKGRIFSAKVLLGVPLENMALATGFRAGVEMQSRISW